MKNAIMLKKNYEFRRVLTKGKSYIGDNIIVYIMDNPKNTYKIKYQKNKNYLGLAISVKTAKAVKRNKIKRLIKENYTILEDRIELGKSIVFLWNKKSKIENANFNNIRKDLINILKKAQILKYKEDEEFEKNNID